MSFCQQSVNELWIVYLLQNFSLCPEPLKINECDSDMFIFIRLSYLKHFALVVKYYNLLKQGKICVIKLLIFLTSRLYIFVETCLEHYLHDVFISNLPASEFFLVLPVVCVFFYMKCIFYTNNTFGNSKKKSVGGSNKIFCVCYRKKEDQRWTHNINSFWNIFQEKYNLERK